MAAFELFLGDPHGEVLLSRKKRAKNPPVDVLEIVGAEHLLLALDLDPYVPNRVWWREGVIELRKVVAQSVETQRARVQSAVLVETGLETVQPWVEPLIAQRLQADEDLGWTSRLLALLERAEGGDGTVIFWGD